MSEPARSRPPLRVVEDPEVERLKRVVKNLEWALNEARLEKEALQTTISTLSRKVDSLSAANKKLRHKKDQEIRDHEQYETAHKIWDFWRRQCRPTAVKMTRDQANAVLARLADTTSTDEPAFSPTYICEAVIGAREGAYTDPRTGRTYNDLELICRSAQKLQDFHHRYEIYAERKARSERCSSA